MTLMNDKVHAYKDQIGELSDVLPGVVKAYHDFTGECFQSGAIDAKTKQLIALGIGLFANNEVCTFYHVEEARAKGATDQEIMETVAVAGAVGGGHALSQGAMRVQKALH
ncbi:MULTISPECIES: carboxymuconolactone decarboxylase family protein [Paenibacillus]|jgi:AhpD family alkylhydroperoxidase|uniref:carboxymuconolactone decarboxylase family protein n=1 Tax=Paenibacillus TaxID=44249 RepID=UPI000BA5EE57|nr:MULTISPECIES: carboxymuconolactone decarboxylase family protein [Paenibacillus]MBY0218491.1 carboxymuconolactone decarboxylase family protein [Paenibacillus illinoisensis]MCM3205281.1 carboxymuconolactone decarboxylase family protein [Paenibacillus illinoisensis]PAF32419.1 gamma-carboxymuconolactone decarboxylase [Paenibacillus sp. 7516]WJH30193.1 carboxymuconolactone decarboxylase family protein [Paenibacillus sp. CC-CFT742]